MFYWLFLPPKPLTISGCCYFDCIVVFHHAPCWCFVLIIIMLIEGFKHVKAEELVTAWINCFYLLSFPCLPHVHLHFPVCASLSSFFTEDPCWAQQTRWRRVPKDCLASKTRTPFLPPLQHPVHPRPPRPPGTPSHAPYASPGTWRPPLPWSPMKWWRRSGKFSTPTAASMSCVSVSCSSAFQAIPHMTTSSSGRWKCANYLASRLMGCASRGSPEPPSPSRTSPRRSPTS